MIPLLSAILLLLQAVISVHTELVAVPVIVTDARGHHVSGLSQENFRVFEDGRPQPIAVFHHGDVPVTLGPIVDRSQSMRARTRALVAAVSALLQSSRPDDQLFAVGVGAQQPLIRPGVAPPSSDFTTYTEGELVRVSIPSNWRELPGSNAVTFAPEGAYGNAGVKSVFTHGLGMGLARNDKRNLQMMTDDFIESHVLVNPGPGRTFRHRRVTIGDRPGLHTVLSSVSEATGEPERIEVFTMLLRDGTLFYVLAVAPRDDVSDYAATFRRVMGSIQIMDCDRCVH